MQMLMILNIVLYMGWSYGELRRTTQVGQMYIWPICLLATTALSLHGFLLYRHIDTHLGQNLALINIISLLAWTMCLLIFLFSWHRVVSVLQTFAAPIATASLIVLWLWPETYILQAKLNTGEVSHILLSLLSVCVLGLSGLQAVLLAVQHRLLRTANSKLAMIFPPIQSMERLLFQLIAVGFIFLSLSLLSGFWFLSFKDTSVLFEKVGFALCAWVVFAVLLWGRYHFGWRGQTAVRFSLGGFLLLVVSYFGTRLLLAFGA